MCQKGFNFLLSQISMQAKKVKIANEVHILTDKTLMKFIPNDGPEEKAALAATETTPMPQPQTSPLSFITSIFKRNKGAVQGSIKEAEQAKGKTQDQNAQGEPVSEQSISQGKKETKQKREGLKFAAKLTSEHILIGNEAKLDLIFILGINSNNYVETEHLWKLKYPEPIDHIGVDSKKQNLFAVVTGKKMHVYKYDNKKLNNEVLPAFKVIELEEKPKFFQIVKDGNLCVFYEDRLDIYLVAEQVHKRFSKKYERPPSAQLPNVTFTLFKVPDPFENIVTVFFEEKNPDKYTIFTLWCIQVEFLTSEIKTHPPQKIYDIKLELKNTLFLKNYSKQIFLMNLGNQILALKKGYILDSATVNLLTEKSFLEYVGNETLLHISKDKIEVYSFVVNLVTKPYRIIIKPKDSIRIPQNNLQDQFFRVLYMLPSNDLVVFFQTRHQNSPSRSGQVEYSFYITRAISRENKMNILFPASIGEDLRIDDPALMDKIDMAEKMGLTNTEIYLQLWNRSQQSRKEDYTILIATKDYGTINKEIIRKLKKSSMNFKQIRDIEESCFFMLEHKVFNSSCTQEIVMDYITSHFLRRKLEMFKDIQLMERFEKERETGKEEIEIFKMNIRQYQEYKSMEIKSELISLVNQFCHENKKNYSKNIRFLLRNFKFVFRMIYYELLEAIIKEAKNQLLGLLTEIPELLPYQPRDEERPLYIPHGFYEGVWPQISKQQWSSSLYVEAVTTIDNKEIVLEHVIKSISFKRNWLSQHDMIIDSVDKIKANYEKIKSPLTFYFFIAAMFKYIENEAILVKLVDYLESTYELPNNIKGRIFLNKKLYDFFVKRGIAPEIESRIYTFSEFLAFEDKQLIRHCFNKERDNKGLLLHDIKNIFKQVLGQDGDTSYNDALLNYFTSDLSQISDLKYILNRINNQKLQFHQQNEKMYECLVTALQIKLKIGTDDDIPVEQVLKYIENVVWSESSDSLKQLSAISKLNQEVDMLREAKLNMSIKEILNNSQIVLQKLIHHDIETANPEIWGDIAKFDRFMISKLARLESFAQDVYEPLFAGSSRPSLSKVIFFLFLAKLCEQKDRIKFADYLIKHPQFKQRNEEDITESLVPFMIKWKYDVEKQIAKNEQYVTQLFTLINSDSYIYLYFRSELQFAKMLSAPGHPILYPINGEDVIGATDLRDIIFDLPVEHVLKIDINYLYQITYQMQQALLQSLEDVDDLEQAEVNPAAKMITKHQILEFVIIKLINENKLKEALVYIRWILDEPIADPNYNIVYLILFIIQLSPELIEGDKINLTMCISHYFYDPKGLLAVLEELTSRPLTPSQVRSFIQGALEQGKLKHKGYNEKNPALSDIYLSVINNAQTEANFMLTLQKTTKHIQQAKEEFKHIKYAAIMIMLCNSPYTLAKYISCSYNYDINVKSIRSFLSYAIKQQVFSPTHVLEYGKRIFMVLLEHVKEKFPIEVVIERYDGIEIEGEAEIDNYEPPEDTHSFEYLMYKSSEAFSGKKKAYLAECAKAEKEVEESVYDKTERIRSQLDQVPNLDEKQPNQYPFEDSDNELNAEGNIVTESIKNKKRKHKDAPKFDASMEMNNILKNEKKSHKLFMSTRADINKNASSLSVSVRNPSFTTKAPIHESLKPTNKSRSNRKIEPGLQLGQSQEFNEDSQCQTERELHLRPCESVVDSEARFSADSSPEIRHAQTEDQVIESGKKRASYFGRGPLTASQELQQQQLPQLDSRFDNQINRIRQVSREDMSKDISRDQSGLLGDGSMMNYKVNVNEVYDQDEIDQFNLGQPMATEQVFQNLEGEHVARIVDSLLQLNREPLENQMLDFNTQLLGQYGENQEILVQVGSQIYSRSISQAKPTRYLRLIGLIAREYPVLGISEQVMQLVIRTQQSQAKTIAQFSFHELIPDFTQILGMGAKRDVFEAVYGNLVNRIDSENIYKISQFIRRAFDEPEYEQEVTWNFLLDLCDKVRHLTEADKSMNIEKVKANLTKVGVNVWVKGFDSFCNKVIRSSEKEALLQVFCNFLLNKRGNSEAIEFLEKVQAQQSNQLVQSTLQALRS